MKLLQVQNQLPSLIHFLLSFGKLIHNFNSKNIKQYQKKFVTKEGYYSHEILKFFLKMSEQPESLINDIVL